MELKDLEYEKIKNMLTDYSHSSTFHHEELVIDKTMEHIFTRINQYDETKSAFKTWCIAILRNNYLYEIREKRGGRQLHYANTTYLDEFYGDEDILVFQLEGDVNDVEDDDSELLRLSIKELGYEELYLFLYSGLKQTEIAYKLGMNINTLKSKITKQRKDIEKILKKVNREL